MSGHPATIPYIQGKEFDFRLADYANGEIECSESIVFAGGYEEWLNKTRDIAIELHDDECKNIFNAAIARYSFACTSNENVVCCKTY